MRKAAAVLLNLAFPDDCRVCSSPLSNYSRIPVCPACLEIPKPFVAEHYCVSCNSPFINAYPLDENGQCGLCRRGLTGFDAAYSFGEYEGTLRKLVHLFKYSNVETLSNPLGRMMVSALPRDIRFDLVTAMPLHWTRRWKRGFNQAEALARVAADSLRIPLVSVLKRTRATPQQANLTNAQRRLNVRGAFEVRDKARIANQHVLLVDDVFTTGATAGACAAVLKRAGAKRVTVLTLARADRRPITIMSTESSKSDAVSMELN